VLGLETLLDLPGLGDDLDRVEDALHQAVRSDDAFLTEVASHLLDAGGKRLRPALTVAVGRLAAGSASEAVVLGGASVELVHVGSLCHDDVIDEATTRRSVETVNARWGNLVAILTGDFLLARASELAATLGPEVSELLAATIGHLCEGQVRELRHAFDVGRTEDAYLAAIAGKTASLLSTSCRIGALTAGLGPVEVAALTEFGRQVGMAFQVVDDLLDLVGTSEALGKPAGHDLVEGVYTLPVIWALAEADTGAQLKELLGRPLSADEVERARAVVRSNGAITAAADLARRYADAAASALQPLAGGPVVQALAGLGHHLVDSLPL
jgi:heptaprenyl diphosphate synthase